MSLPCRVSHIIRMKLLLPFIVSSVLAKNYSMIEMMDAEGRLMDFIFEKQGYRKELAATFKSRGSEATHPPKIVNVTLTYAKLLNLNELEQTFKTIVEAFTFWEDERLVWNPSDFNGVDMLMLHRDSIWVPDVVAYDLSDYNEPIPQERQMVIVFSNGTCGWYSSAIATFMCEINVSDFPFDQQACAIKYSVYYSTNKELVLHGKLDENFGITIMGNNQWNVTGVRILNRTFEDSEHKWTFSEINYIFTMQRSDSYYVVLLIIPSFVLTFLCMAGLFWAPISFDTYMDKLNLGFAAILAMVFVLQITTDNIPKTAQMAILSISTLINLSLITLASLTVLIVGKFFTRKNCKSSPSTIFYFASKHVHLLLLGLFFSATVANLAVLLSRKGRSVAKFAD